jgi:hypothetical protein
MKTTASCETMRVRGWQSGVKRSQEMTGSKTEVGSASFISTGTRADVSAVVSEEGHGPGRHVTTDRTVPFQNRRLMTFRRLTPAPPTSYI